MDIWSKKKRSAVMAKIRSKDTKPEWIVRRYLFSRGYRYRTTVKGLPGTPDIVMAGRRLAIFVHGCFWHGHDCARGSRVPKANRDYWLAKVARNKARDVAAEAALIELGWRVETIWECDLKNAEALDERLRRLVQTPLTGAGRDEWRKP